VPKRRRRSGQQPPVRRDPDLTSRINLYRLAARPTTSLPEQRYLVSRGDVENASPASTS
jgi:hypothetical protein